MARKPVKSEKKDVIPPAETLKYLYNLGYFNGLAWAKVKNLRGAELSKVIKSYQKFNNLEPNGHVDEKTAHRLSRRRCGLPDFGIAAPSGSPCRWPMKDIAYYHDVSLPGMQPEQVLQAYDVAFGQWAEVCDIEPKRVERKEVANIYARSGRGKKHNLDDRGGTLAWSELPCDVSTHIQLDQMFDEAEDWSFNMAVAVMCHELGHALGLGHLNFGALMAPYYDPNVTKPQQEDIEEITKLYGRRTKPYALQNGLVQLSGEIVINGQAYVLVPKK
jgi:hypothetical protein